MLVAVCRFVYVDGGRVPVVIEGADVVLLHISVFVGDCDGECNGHVVAERACLVAEARRVDVLLKRPRGCVAVDDSASVVGDGERVSACEVQRVVGASDDSLACEEVVDLLVGAVGDDGELHDWCPFIVLSGSYCSAFSRVRGDCCACASASCAATSAGKRNSLVAGVAEVRV